MGLCLRASKSVVKCSSRRNLDSFKVRLIFSYSFHQSACPSYDGDTNDIPITKTYTDSHFGYLILKTVEKMPWAFGSKNWVFYTSPQLRAVIFEPELLIRVLNSIRGKPKVAFRFFRWADAQPGFNRSGFAFCTMLEILVQSNLMGQTYSLMRRIISLDFIEIVDVLIDGYVNKEVSVKLLDILLGLCITNSMVEHCLSVFNKMVWNGFYPDVKVCNRILRMLRDRDLVDKAREVYTPFA